MKRKTNNKETGNNGSGFKILLARRKEVPVMRGLLFAFFMVVPPVSAMILSKAGVIDPKTADSSQWYIRYLFDALFAPLPILFGYMVFDYYLLTSYIVNGYLKFENEGLEYYYNKKIRTRMDYRDIVRIELNYVDYERISYFSFTGSGKRTHGADNTLDITHAGGEKNHCNFLCRKRRDIIKIKELMRFLKNTKGVEILYSEKGKTLPL